MKKCSTCNLTYEDTKNFCKKCGKPLVASTASTVNASARATPPFAKGFTLKRNWTIIAICVASIIVVFASVGMFILHSSSTTIIGKAKCNAEAIHMVLEFSSETDARQAAKGLSNSLKGECHNLFFSGRSRLVLQTTANKEHLDALIEKADHCKVLEERSFFGPVGISLGRCCNLSLVRIRFEKIVSDDQIREVTGFANSIIQHISSNNEIMLWIPEPDSSVEKLRSTGNVVEASLKTAGYNFEIRCLENVRAF